MAYTNPPHLHENIYQNQTKRHRGEKARAGDYAEVRQDKGHFANAPHVAGEPAPFANDEGARAVNTKAPRTQKTHTGRTKHIHSTVHYDPRVHGELKRIAGKFVHPR